MRAGLDRLAQRLGSGPVRGEGLLLALDLPPDRPAAALCEALRARASTDGERCGLLLNPVRAHTLRFLPALDIGREDVALALQLIDEALAA